MQRILLSLFLLTLFSCDYFDKKKVYSNDILEEELKTFSWNEVDEYPTFASCDSTQGKLGRKQCFENTLRAILNKNLSRYTIVVSEAVEDTVNLQIQIGNRGEFSIKSIHCSTLTKQQIPQLDSLLRRSFDSLPEIYPAIKRSQQVTTQFDLPVIIKIE